MKDKPKILWIAPFLPYKSVPHAGGKTFYFYLNSVVKSDEFNINLIAFYRENEINKFAFKQNITSDIYCYYEHGIKKIFRKAKNIGYKLNPLNKYGGMVSRYIESKILHTARRRKREGYCPNVIILHWTQVILLLPKLKKIFPTSKFISIEEDVTLLSFQRRIQLATSPFKKKWANIRFKKIERTEIQTLRLSDIIVVNNSKDHKLLLSYGISDNMIKCNSAFFNKYSDCVLQENSNSVIFYGAMDRKENYLSAEWLLNKVRPLLSQSDIKFIIVGAKPPEQLLAYRAEDVLITGYVDDVTPYFESALCFAAPLILGAGVKVKVLEAMSAGLPVLTNEVGIEGIPASDGHDYFFCQSPEDYAKAILGLKNDRQMRLKIGENAKKLIDNNFNYIKDAENFSEILHELSQSE